MASLLYLHALLLHAPPSCLPSLPTLPPLSSSTRRLGPLTASLSINRHNFTRPHALAESDSSPKPATPTPGSLLQELSDSLDLPADYFAKLPGDLRLDLNDAAFNLSSGAVIDECGQDLGQTLLNLSRAWESADASTSHSLARRLPSLTSSLADSERSAFGQRLISAGGRFQSMGLYEQGELQKISETMISAGQALCASSSFIAPEQLPETETRILKFGELQVAVTPENATVGATIGVLFGTLSWIISQGIQSVPESSLQYANDNALQLAKSLRGALLVMFYASTVLSALSSVGLVLLAQDLKSKEK
ncbi:hypothetical protein Droror1_Dr00025055 [Drosera rotundifolia]